MGRPALPFTLASLCALGWVIACSSEPAPPTTVRDAGARVDAGADAGAPDAGGEDAGMIEDAGTDAGEGAVDGGEEDAGHDAGEPDAGVDDTGVDAGTDAGCFADAGQGQPPNLLYNPGFECGGAEEGWNSSFNAVLGTEIAVVHSGMQAARITATTAGANISLFPFAIPVQQVGAATMCAAAWVRGPSGATARISLQVTNQLGAFNEYTFSSPLDGTWQRIDVDHTTVPADDRVTMRVWMPNAANGASLLVDDADLFRSTSSTCPVR